MLVHHTVFSLVAPPPLSKARLGEKKARSDRGVRLGQGAPWTPLFLHFAYKPKTAVQKKTAVLSGGAPWTRGALGQGGVHICICIYITLMALFEDFEMQWTLNLRIMMGPSKHIIKYA